MTREGDGRRDHGLVGGEGGLVNLGAVERVCEEEGERRESQRWLSIEKAASRVAQRR